MEHVIELMDEMVGTLSETVKSDVIFGKAVELGPNKIVPLSRVGIGFGGGGGEGDQRFGNHREKKNRHSGGKGSGGGGGGGAKVRPIGVLIFTEDGVRMEAIPDKSGLFDKLFGKIPEIIDLAHQHKS